MQIGDELTVAVQTALAASGVPAANQTAAGVTDTSEQPHTHGSKPKLQQKQQTQLQSNCLKKAGVGDAQESAAASSAILDNVGKPEKAAEPLHPSLARAVRPFHPSGDDLGDAFAAELEDAEDAGTRRKKKKALTSTDTDLQPGNLGSLALSKRTNKSKHKVVSF